MLKMMRPIIFLLAVSLAGCASTKPPEPTPLEIAQKENALIRLQVESKTQELLSATSDLRDAQMDLDDQSRRLQLVCVDYPEHPACNLHAAETFARQAFCNDQEFTTHIDDVVRSCKQGQCKQVDEATYISRTDYMRLVQRLPHSLVTFRGGSSRLDKGDKKQLQYFLEHVGAERGYVIIVGRASKDGPWRKNVKYALDRAENTRAYLVDQLGLDQERVGYITYGTEKMYITELDAERLSTKKLSERQANRSALVFSYPCYK